MMMMMILEQPGTDSTVGTACRCLDPKSKDALVVELLRVSQSGHFPPNLCPSLPTLSPAFILLKLPPLPFPHCFLVTMIMPTNDGSNL